MEARGWVRVAALASTGAVIAIVLLGAVSSAPAVVQPPTVQMSVVTGLDEITYGRNAAYDATIVNTSGRTLKNVSFVNPTPTTEADDETLPATFRDASCSGNSTPTGFACNAVDKLRSGESLTVRIVWQTPTAGTSPNCPAEPSTCMTNSASWFVGSVELPMGPVATGLLAADDPNKVAGYPLSACSDPSSTPTVFTFQTIGPNNPLTTSVCAAIPDGGLAVAVEEAAKAPEDPGVAPQGSEICMPAGCGGSPFVFSPMATFTFVIANSSLPAGETIDKVYHDGVLVSTRPRDDPHVVSIKVQNFKGITTVVVRSSRNGGWTFG